jgi:hypothetical protein
MALTMAFKSNISYVTCFLHHYIWDVNDILERCGGKSRNCPVGSNLGASPRGEKAEYGRQEPVSDREYREFASIRNSFSPQRR